MMLCKADFQELFPDLFPPQAAPRAQAPDPEPQAAINPDLHYGLPGMVMAGARAAQVAANEAAWAVPPAAAHR